MEVISDLLMEPKHFLFMMSDKGVGKDSLTLIKPDFKSRQVEDTTSPGFPE